jgi:hypothetical protein
VSGAAAAGAPIAHSQRRVRTIRRRAASNAHPSDAIRNRGLSETWALAVVVAGLAAQAIDAVWRRAVAFQRRVARLSNALIAATNESVCALASRRDAFGRAISFVRATSVRIWFRAGDDENQS